MKMEARIPFDGFYESKYDKEIDYVEEQLAESLAEEHGIKKDDVYEIVYKNCNYREVHRHIAKEFVPYFEEFINRELGLKLSMKYNDMTSPREYNFETDKIFVEVDYVDMLRLARRVGRDALRKAAKDMFTSRDGFISFYRSDISEWGHVCTWDHNQLYCLMNAALEVIGEEDWDWDIYACMSENGVFSTAHDKALDYPTIMFEVGKLVAAKEIAEEAEEQEDGKRFPVAFANTEDYVKKYCAMNGVVFDLLKGDL